MQKSGQIGLRLDEGLNRLCRNEAERLHIGISSVIRIAISEYFARRNFLLQNPPDACPPAQDTPSSPATPPT